MTPGCKAFGFLETASTMTQHPVDLEPADVHAALSQFNTWLQSLSADATCLASAAEDEVTPAPAQAVSKAVCLHVLRVTEHQQGVEDLVALECAILLRLAATGHTTDVAESQTPTPLYTLREQAAWLERSLPEEWPLLQRFLHGLTAFDGDSQADQKMAQQHTVAEAAPEEAAASPWSENAQADAPPLAERMAAWAKDYVAPRLADGAHDWMRLRAFLRTRSDAGSERST